MGTPIHEIIIVPGATCGTCWGAGKSFELPTPKFITMSLHDWTEGPAWNEMYRAELEAPAVLDDLIFGACSYFTQTANFDWSWGHGGGITSMQVRTTPPGISYAFYNIAAPECQVELPNIAALPLDVIASGGYASIVFGS